MNSYFERLDLEMIALESAIGAFEAENDITDEYLHDYSDYEAPAYESASSGDDFGFGLFDDMYVAPATEDADDGSKGSKLGQGIKNILGNIKKFFGKVKDGIVSFFNSFKKKKAEVKADEVKKNAEPEALKLADTMRGSIKQAYNIIGNITVTDTKFIASLCEKISKALDDAGGSDLLVATHMNFVKQIDSDAGTDTMTDAGKSFRQSGHFGNNESETGRLAEKKLAEAEDILAKVDATGKDLDTALDNVSSIFKKEFTAAYNKYKANSSKEATAIDGETTFDIERHEEEEKTKREREGKLKDAELREYNKSAKARNSVGGGDFRAQKTKDIPMAKLVNQVRQIVFVDYDANALDKAVKAVIDACSKHASNCDKLANKVPANVSGDAKIAYTMCKVLSKSSNIYTHISNSIQRLTSGSVFNVNMSNGDATITGAGKFETRRMDRADAKKNQKAYLDE